jgi:type IV pilus assembly protein PilW
MNQRALIRRQQGYTLIELMVALLISLFLLAGLITLEQGMRSTYGNQSQLAQLQDNERFALTILGEVVQEAGYFPSPTVYTETTALPAAGAFAAKQPITGVYSAAAPNDTLSVRFLTASGDTNINCTGGTNTSGAVLLYTNVFSISAGANPALQCAVNGAAAQTLVNGVTNLEVWYGVKTNGAVTTNDVDSYLRASVMTAANWQNVTSVKVRLTFTNPLFGQPGQAATVQITRIIAVMQRSALTV